MAKFVAGSLSVSNLSAEGILRLLEHVWLERRGHQKNPEHAESHENCIIHGA